jgi:hypothetical protein
LTLMLFNYSIDGVSINCKPINLTHPDMTLQVAQSVSHWHSPYALRGVNAQLKSLIQLRANQETLIQLRSTSEISTQKL